MSDPIKTWTLNRYTKPIIRNATFPLPCDNITDPDLKAIFKNCDKMCNNCEFQCMRNTEKTRLLGFCAESKVLFDFCPEYDEKTGNIQTDQMTPCNSNSSQSYYKSSNWTACNEVECSTLHETSPSIRITTEIVKQPTGGVTSGYPMSNGTNTRPNDTIIASVLVVVGAFGLFIILAVKFGWKPKCQRKKKVTRTRAKNKSQESFV